MMRGPYEVFVRRPSMRARVRSICTEPQQLFDVVSAVGRVICCQRGLNFHGISQLADLPLLSSLLEHRARFARTWIKLPPSFDPKSLPGATPEAFFGVGAGDAQRVKFLLLQFR